MPRFANSNLITYLSSIFSVCVLIALSAAPLRSAENEEEYNLDLPWAKQMTYNNDPIKAAYAIRWLGEQKTNDAEAIKRIVEHLGDERQSAPAPPMHVNMRVPPVGDVAEDALKQIGAPAVPELIKFFESKAKPDAKIRGLTAIEAIGKAASAAFPVIAKLAAGDLELAIKIKGLDQREADTLRQQAIKLRYHAYIALAAITTEPEKLLAALEPALHEADDYIQLSAIKGLAKVGAPAKILVPELIKLLDSEKVCQFHCADFMIGESLAVAAAESLASLGPEAKAALPALSKKLTHENEHLQTAAAYAHTVISGERSPGIEVLLKELNNPKTGREYAHYYAPEYLVKLARQGKFPDDTLVAFRKMLRHKAWTARNLAIDGIVIMKPAEAVSLLQPLVEEKESLDNMWVRGHAARAIHELTESPPQNK